MKMAQGSGLKAYGLNAISVKIYKKSDFPLLRHPGEGRDPVNSMTSGCPWINAFQGRLTRSGMTIGRLLRRHQT
jgi:hypothetical protein